MSKTSMMIFGVMVVVVCGLVIPAGASTVYLKNNRSLTGSVEWREATQDYLVTMAQGAVPASKADVVRLAIDRPATYDQAAGMVKGRVFGQAIPLLEKIVKDYRMLTWDVEAGKLLALSYLETKDLQKAIMTMDALFAATSRDKVPASLQMAYWKALLADHSNVRLRKELEKAIGTASLDTVCAAYMIRANMFLKAGDEDEALSDYLKVINLGQNFKTLMPEALFNAAALFDNSRDPRGADLRKRLIKEYPGNDYAIKAAVPPRPSAAPASPAAPARPR